MTTFFFSSYSRHAEDDHGDSGSSWYNKYDRPSTSDHHHHHHHHHHDKDDLSYDPLGGVPYDPQRFDQVVPSSSAESSAFVKVVNAGKSSGHRNISSIKKRIKRFEEEFENKFGYKPSHSEKMKHKEIKKYMSDLNKARKELKSKSMLFLLALLGKYIIINNTSYNYI